MAGEHEIESRLQILRHRHLLGPFAEIRGRGEIGIPGGRRLHRDEFVDELLLHVAIPCLERIEVEGHRAEERLAHILVVHRDHGPRFVPHALGGDVHLLRLDLLGEVETLHAAVALREHRRAALRVIVRLDQIVLRLEHTRPREQRPRGNLVVRPLIHEPLQRRLVSFVHLGADRLVLRKRQPPQIRINQRRPVRVLLVEGDQVLVELDRLELPRRRVGRGRFPLQELGAPREHRAVRADLEFILRLRRALLARLVKLQRLVREEIEHRRAIRIGHAALVEQVVVMRDRRRLQLLLVRQRRGELPVDLREDARQIPRREILPRRLGGLRPLLETPAVLLEVMPVPIGENRLHHRLHLRRRRREFRLEPRDFFLRLVPLDVPLEGDLRADGLDGLCVSLVLQRVGDDWLQLFDGGLGQPFVAGFLDLLPTDGGSRGEHGDGAGDEGGGFEFADEHGFECCLGCENDIRGDACGSSAGDPQDGAFGRGRGQAGWDSRGGRPGLRGQPCENGRHADRGAAPREAGAELFTGAAEPDAKRAVLALQGGRRLLHAAALEVDHHQRQPVLGREGVEFTVERLAQRGGGFRGRFMIGIVVHGSSLLFSSKPALAGGAFIAGGAKGDMVQPSAQRAFPPERPGLAGQGEENRLRGILGGMGILQHALADPEDHRHVAADQLGKRLLGSPGCERREQFRFRLLCLVLWHVVLNLTPCSQRRRLKCYNEIHRKRITRTPSLSRFGSSSCGSHSTGISFSTAFAATPSTSCESLTVGATSRDACSIRRGRNDP